MDAAMQTGCSNGGTCDGGSGKAVCECTQHWQGPNCMTSVRMYSFTNMGKTVMDIKSLGRLCDVPTHVQIDLGNLYQCQNKYKSDFEKMFDNIGMRIPGELQVFQEGQSLRVKISPKGRSPKVTRAPGRY